MLNQLPSLNGLRVFEVAARRLSFSSAAEELFVTPAAVSYQIKSLERELGVLLFQRLNKSVALTPEGRQFLISVRAGLIQIEAGVRAVKEAGLGGDLNVSVVPSFAQQWLLPRLESFYLAYPKINLRLNATQLLADFKRDGNHLAIRYGTGPWKDLHHEPLMMDRIFAVGAPSLLQERGMPEKPLDLMTYPLLHDTTQPWQAWFARLGFPNVVLPAGPLFDDANLLLYAAIKGHGLTLTRTSLAAAELKAGRLIRALAQEVDAGKGYHLVCPPTNRSLPKVSAFWDWLLEQAKPLAVNA